ncbi:YdcF family protein [Pelagibius marinus]|uniref:YdcF family protein n=1 Tax=Pelagibius marinus TaxID=2762760 RepID=UPI001872920F|nr:YdcF family protein [Pelagibius marinus]
MATAFFFLSKVGWFLVKPLNSLLFCLLAWLGCRRFGWHRGARFFGAVLLLYGGAIVLTPLPELALRSLENRFPAPQVDSGALAGIIVLGGATDSGAVAATRGQVALNDSAERLTTVVALHRAMPALPIVVSGFSGRLRLRGWNEAEITQRLFEQLGVDMSKVRFEAESRNTAENARLTMGLLGDEGDTAGGPWLLVTSAAHMPRAVASFRSAGLPLLPYPVDYKTEPDNLLWPRDIGGSFGLAGAALHEWLGLAVYYVTGRSAELFPGPR